MKTLYLCDRRKCDKCNEWCKHTEDITHAKKFEIVYDTMTEKESEDMNYLEVENAELRRLIKELIKKLEAERDVKKGVK